MSANFTTLVSVETSLQTELWIPSPELLSVGLISYNGSDINSWTSRKDKGGLGLTAHKNFGVSSRIIFIPVN